MTEELPPPATDEPPGDVADQATRLQMAEEHAAIKAALAGQVHGSDALEERSPVVDPLEGPELQDGDTVDASDDPVYAGGTTVTEPEQSRLEDDVLDQDLTMTGLVEDGEAMTIDEGSTVQDSATGFELDGDPEFVDLDLAPGDEAEAEDVDALTEVLDLGHDLDDPSDPDGYGVPPAPDGGSAAVDLADLRDPVDDG